MRMSVQLATRTESGDRLFTAWAVTLTVLVAVTAPLWLGAAGGLGSRGTPRVAPFPLLESIAANTPFVTGVGLLGLIGVGVLLSRPGARVTGAITASLALAMAFDQLRWQPWAWHAVIAGAAMATLTPRTARFGLRTVAIAVYAYSAIAKLDAAFAWTLGQQMVGPLLAVVGVELESLDDRTRTLLALSLPAGELALAVLLAVSLRWRRLAWPACVAACLMHATTVGVLGPWGLGHSLGVLLWNIGFAWQTVVLFRPSRGGSNPSAESQSSEDAAATSAKPRPAAAVGVLACLLGVVAPLGTPFGVWDQWPGWALYAPGGERATLYVHAAALERLPHSIEPHVAGAESDPGGGPWRRVALDDWALAETGAPIYPQNRVVAAIGAGLIERFALSGRVLVRTESAADRWTTKREAETLADAQAMLRASELAGLRPTVAWP